MIFDKQEHKDALLAMFKQAVFPGAMVDMAFELKQAMLQGGVADPGSVGQVAEAAKPGVDAGGAGTSAPAAE